LREATPMGTRLRFCFELEPVENIEPWVTMSAADPSKGLPSLVGPSSTPTGTDPHLSWYTLTFGRYWISTSLGEVLRYTDDTVRRWKLSSRYVDYEIGQLFWDLQEQYRFAMEPVPAELAVIVSDPAWYARAQAKMWAEQESGDESFRDLWWDALEWWNKRVFCTGYLTAGPSFRIWRVGDEISVRWESDGEAPEEVWTLPEGEIRISADEFTEACFSFFDELTNAMQERVTNIEREGWQRKDCRLDIDQLVADQRKQAAGLKRLKDKHAETDWVSAAKLLRSLCSRLDSSGTTTYVSRNHHH